MRAYVGIGTNLGDRSQNIKDAVFSLGNLGQVECSSIYESESVGYDGPAFLNAVGKVETVFPVNNFFSYLQRIEDALGRTRSVPNAPRTIDLDLLLFDDLRLDGEIILPHPRMYERKFVLVPLLEILGGEDLVRLPQYVH